MDYDNLDSMENNLVEENKEGMDHDDMNFLHGTNDLANQNLEDRSELSRNSLERIGRKWKRLARGSGGFG